MIAVIEKKMNKGVFRDMKSKTAKPKAAFYKKQVKEISISNHRQQKRVRNVYDEAETEIVND